MEIGYIEETLEITENSIENVLDMLSVPINYCFSLKNSNIKINNEILKDKDIDKMIALFKRDKYLNIKVDGKVTIFFFENNYIVKRIENENNYKIYIKENEKINENKYINWKAGFPAFFTNLFYLIIYYIFLNIKVIKYFKNINCYFLINLMS